MVVLCTSTLSHKFRDTELVQLLVTSCSCQSHREIHPFGVAGEQGIRVYNLSLLVCTEKFGVSLIWLQSPLRSLDKFG